MTKDFLEAIAKRRSVYGIGKDTDVTQERVQEIVEQALLYTPTAFNSQSARILTLFGEHHQKLWDITRETLRKIVPADAFPQTEQKLDSFAAGAGTILVFEDMSVVESLQAQFALYKDNFPIWSLESNGMLQLVIWTALEQEGLGVSLQHYDPLIDDEVKSRWDIPASWKLLGQMPFGAKTAEPDEKPKLPVKDRLKVFR